MLVINNLTSPGGIKRVDLNPTTVRVVTSDNKEIIYKAVTNTVVESGVIQRQQERVQ